MAHLEDLISQVDDAALREALEHEVKALKQRVPFGLVFERHLPEFVLLPAASARLAGGDAVQLRTKPQDRRTWRVESVSDGEALIVADDGETCRESVEELLDNNDVWHDSKWLSMMEKRLRLAKRLLKPDGVLICTIDAYEANHLGTLLEQKDLFRDYLRYMVTIVINPKGRGAHNFGRVDEYAFFAVPATGSDVIASLPPPDDTPDAHLTAEVADDDGVGPWVRDISASGELRLPVGVRRALSVEDEADQVELELRDDGIAELRGLPADESEEDDDQEDTVISSDGEVTFESRHLRRRGAESSFRTKRQNQFYAIKVNEKTKTVVGIGPELEKDAPYEVGHKKGDILWLYPIDQEGRERVWRYNRATMQGYIDQDVIKVGMYDPKKPQPYTLNHLIRREGRKVQRLRTVWWRKSHDAGTHGTTLISRLLGEATPFPFPKSLYAVRDCLEAVVKDRPDALIIDFFAGSGTTLHATALLNQADGAPLRDGDQQRSRRGEGQRPAPAATCQRPRTRHSRSPSWTARATPCCSTRWRSASSSQPSTQRTRSSMSSW